MKLYALKGDISSSKVMAFAKLAEQELNIECLKPNFHLESKFKKVFTFKSLPILEIAEGKTLLKSNAMIRYLASTSPKKNEIYGSDEMSQAKVDALLDLLSTELEHAIILIMAVVQGKICAPQKAIEDAEKTIDKVLTHLCQVIKQNGNTDYLVGNQMTIADVAMAVMLSPIYRFVMTEEYWTKSVPEVKRWVERCYSHEHVRTTIGCLTKPCSKRLEIPASDEA